MKLAVMQPYLFPYLGYFQLIGAVDAFVVYDDVNYIKGGWVNRNFVLGRDGRQLLTLPLQGASSNLLINQIELGGRPAKLLETLRHTYGKAPQFGKVFPLLENILLQPELNLARFLEHALRTVCDYLGIHPAWHVSSALDKDNALRGQDKVLAICKELGAAQYINAPGGIELYDHDTFAREGVRLSFIQPRAVVYRQFEKPFEPNLSIIDVMMFNNRERCAKLLEEYELV